MNALKVFFTAFCSASVLIGALHIICPEGAMSKSVKYVLSLVFLLIIISSASVTVKNADFDFSYETPDFSNAEDIKTAAAEYVYASVLKRAGINYKKITVCTDNLPDGSIVISKVIVFSNSDRLAITEALGEAAQNFEVEVVNE